MIKNIIDTIQLKCFHAFVLLIEHENQGMMYALRLNI